LFCSFMSRTQILPSLLIDNLSTQFSGSSLPYWLKAGQTINIGTNAQSVSIIEFTINGVNLEFTQIIALNTVQTVPANKVWKIEAIGLKAENSSIPSSIFVGGGSTSSTASLPTIFQSPKKFEITGTYNWTVPPGITSICIEVWSGGGGGGGSSFGGVAGGGGGGGFAYQCFTVVPGTTYTVNVGAGGAGGTIGSDGTSGGNSSFGNLISVTGGAGGGKNTGGVNDGIGGLGGTSSSTFAIPGNNGNNGTWAPSAQSNGNGGNAGNGGNGGITLVNGNGQPGVIPGGAGSGARSTNAIGGVGARGQVFIYW
jgi:hypothetical protein